MGGGTLNDAFASKCRKCECTFLTYSMDMNLFRDRIIYRKLVQMLSYCSLWTLANKFLQHLAKLKNSITGLEELKLAPHLLYMKGDGGWWTFELDLSVFYFQYLDQQDHWKLALPPKTHTKTETRNMAVENINYATIGNIPSISL